MPLEQKAHVPERREELFRGEQPVSGLQRSQALLCAGSHGLITDKMPASEQFRE